MTVCSFKISGNIWGKYGSEILRGVFTFEFKLNIILAQTFCFVVIVPLKPCLHERFFACDGDAIFLKLSCRQRAAKIASVATL